MHYIVFFPRKFIIVEISYLIVTLYILCIPVLVKKCVTNLGVIFDECLNMKKYFNKICSAGYHALSNLWQMSAMLDEKLKKQLVVAMVLSRLDYCNSRMYGINKREIVILQRLINASVKFIYGKSGEHRNENFREFYIKSHFLSVQCRIFYKIALLVFNSMHGHAPQYLEKLINKQSTIKSTRLGQDEFLLTYPKLENIEYRENRFSIAAPKVWNKLPYVIRSCNSLTTFKSTLKTHYFKIDIESDRKIVEW